MGANPPHFIRILLGLIATSASRNAPVAQKPLELKIHFAPVFPNDLLSTPVNTKGLLNIVTVCSCHNNLIGA
jgi:hypothetical protein